MIKELVTPETAGQIVEALVKRHGGNLRGETFLVTGRVEAGTVVAGGTLSNADRTFVYEMEAAMALPDSGPLTPQDLLDVCMDFLDWYLGEYLREGREILLPLDFQAHRFAEFEVLARGEVRNALLDAAADAWLRGERPPLPVGRRRKPRLH